MMEDEWVKLEERREEVRLDQQQTIYIELEGADPEDPNAAPAILECLTLDLSANGLQVEANNSVPQGAILQLSVEIPDMGRRFHLAGEVMWCRDAPQSGRHLIGFSLYDSDGTEIEQWKLAVANWLSD